MTLSVYKCTVCLVWFIINSLSPPSFPSLSFSLSLTHTHTTHTHSLSLSIYLSECVTVCGRKLQLYVYGCTICLWACPCVLSLSLSPSLPPSLPLPLSLPPSLTPSLPPSLPLSLSGQKRRLSHRQHRQQSLAGLGHILSPSTGE